MAKDKDRAQNPAAAQRKLDKQKALKKGKAAVQAQRTERLATRNPHRLESQIADLHALKESQGGKLSARDQRQLDDLEKDVTRIKKAKEALGDKAPASAGHREGTVGARGRGGGEGRGGGGRGGYAGLGKRRREHADGEAEGSESQETDEDVRKIPWPRDTPPPIPQRQHQSRSHGTSANLEPLAPGRERLLDATTSSSAAGGKPDTALPPKPVQVQAPKTTYESKPQVRDLRKEAMAFVPGVVKRKIEAAKGRGGLLGEEEVGRLEGEGYLVGGGGVMRGKVDGKGGGGGLDVKGGRSGVEGEESDGARRLREEEERFEREIGMAVDEVGGGEGEGKEGKEEIRGDGKGRRALVEDVSDEDL